MHTGGATDADAHVDRPRVDVAADAQSQIKGDA